MDFSNDLLSALTGILDDSKWQKIGKTDELWTRKCTKLYPIIEDEDDMVIQPDEIILFCIEKDEFYAIDCSCPHEGGPLDLGDIEDFDGNLSVICPWHSYDFSLKTGESSTGLKTNVYEVKVVDNAVYLKCDHKVSLTEMKHKYKDINGEVSVEDRPCNDAIVEKCLCTHAKNILNTSDPMEKVQLTHDTVQKWKEGKIDKIGYSSMPHQPRRQEGLETLEPGKIKRGKGGTLQSRIALLHSLANIEQWAIDLSWDIIGRFSEFKIGDEFLPVEFFEDFMKVANDEAKHFTMINKRLKELHSHFGALPVHNGLWESAEETSSDLLARLAIVHMVHEARGLDVHPKTKQRFSSQNDKESSEMIDVIFTDEITHVACGMKWFTYICDSSSPPLDPVATFHKMVKKHFKGYLKPPFNTSARNIAGMSEEWYTPLVKPSST